MKKADVELIYRRKLCHILYFLERNIKSVRSLRMIINFLYFWKSEIDRQSQWNKTVNLRMVSTKQETAKQSLFKRILFRYFEEYFSSVSMGTLKSFCQSNKGLALVST